MNRITDIRNSKTKEIIKSALLEKTTYKEATAQPSEYWIEDGDLD